MNPGAKRDIAGFLRKNSWFGGLPPALQEHILERSSVRTFTKGQLFQIEDAPAIGLVAILEGRVLLMRHATERAPTLVHVALPGFWFGEAAIAGGLTLVTAQAQTAVKALVLPTAEFDRIVAEEPTYYPAFARLIFDRYRVMVDFFIAGRGLSPDERLRLRLADLAELRRLDVTVDGLSVTLDISQAELATLVNLSRQKLNVRLRALQEEGWIDVGPRRITVRDALGLRRSVATLPAGPRASTGPIAASRPAAVAGALRPGVRPPPPAGRGPARPR